MKKGVFYWHQIMGALLLLLSAAARAEAQHPGAGESEVQAIDEGDCIKRLPPHEKSALAKLGAEITQLQQNIQDPKSLAAQIQKVMDRYGAQLGPDAKRAALAMAYQKRLNPLATLMAGDPAFRVAYGAWAQAYASHLRKIKNTGMWLNPLTRDQDAAAFDQSAQSAQDAVLKLMSVIGHSNLDSASKHALQAQFRNMTYALNDRETAKLADLAKQSEMGATTAGLTRDVSLTAAMTILTMMSAGATAPAAEASAAATATRGALVFQRFFQAAKVGAPGLSAAMSGRETLQALAKGTANSVLRGADFGCEMAAAYRDSNALDAAWKGFAMGAVVSGGIAAAPVVLQGYITNTALLGGGAMAVHEVVDNGVKAFQLYGDEGLSREVVNKGVESGFGVVDAAMVVGPARSLLNGVRARNALSQFNKKGSFNEIKPEDNMNYISRSEREAEDMIADSQAPNLFYSNENVLMKTLNDKVIKDKPVVDAVEDAYKHMFWNRVKANPVLNEELDASYSDYKSLRLAFKAQTPHSREMIKEELEKVHAGTAREFAKAMETPFFQRYLQKFEGKIPEAGNWHEGALGSNHDEANLAGRLGRSEMLGENGLKGLTNFKDVYARAQENLKSAEQLRASIQERFGHSPDLLVDSGVANKKILSEESVDITRKILLSGHSDAENLADIQSRLSKVNQLKLSPEDAANIRDYVTATDRFSAAVLQSERVKLPYDKSLKGVVSADFAGQGARNIQETMRGLARSENVDQALLESRRAYDRATDIMNIRRENFKNIVGKHLGIDRAKDFFFTGDDGLAFPRSAVSNDVKQDILRDLSLATKSGGQYRVTYVPQNYADTGKVIPPSERSSLIVDAESVEKALRKNLEGVLRRDELKKLALWVDLNSTSKGLKKIDLHLPKGTSPMAEARIRKTFEDMMKDPGFLEKRMFTSHVPVQTPATTSRRYRMSADSAGAAP
ncbi:MAG: hypothetical protein JST16_09780 [Bdellovibrionales bacterium]|nr:hypothetical protein [Bdellovibrionales bacterium]